MAREESASEDRDCCGDAAAYALGALDRSEADEFRRHLDTCIVCRDELDAFSEVTEALGMSGPRHGPAPAVRNRILRDIRSEGRSAAPPPARRLPHSSLRPLARLRFAAGLLTVVTLAVLGAVTLAPQDRRPTRVIRAQVFGSAGTAQLRLAHARARLIVSHLPVPPSGRTYEVWAERKGRASSPQVLFDVSASGDASVLVPGDLQGASSIMVTQEPAGGSLVPTRAPVLVANLS